MKDAKFTIKSVLILALTALVIAFSFGVTVSAEPDETYAIESFVEETTSPEETTAEEETTEADVSEEATDASETVVQSESSENAETTETQTKETEPEQTEPSYRAPLPSVDSTKVTLPAVIGATSETNEPPLFWGFVSWILIGVGVAVILAVVLSTKTKAYRGGRDRYSSTDKISGKKKLLSQEYYDNHRKRR